MTKKLITPHFFYLNIRNFQEHTGTLITACYLVIPRASKNRKKNFKEIKAVKMRILGCFSFFFLSWRKCCRSISCSEPTDGAVEPQHGKTQRGHSGPCFCASHSQFKLQSYSLQLEPFLSSPCGSPSPSQEHLRLLCSLTIMSLFFFLWSAEPTCGLTDSCCKLQHRGLWLCLAAQCINILNYFSFSVLVPFFHFMPLLERDINLY